MFKFIAVLDDLEISNLDTCASDKKIKNPEYKFAIS